MATDAELLELAEQATPGGASAAGAVDPPPLARQVPPGTPGAVEGPVFKDPGAAPLVDPAIAAVTPGFAPPPAPIAEGAATVVPPPPAAPPAPAVPPPPDFVAPPLRTGRATMASASEAADQATQGAYDTARAEADVGKAKAGEREANAALADRAAVQARANLSDIERQQQAQLQGMEQARQEAAKAEQEFRSTPLHDLLKERTVGERIKSAIFVGLGAAGEVKSGMPGNPALEQIKMHLDNDFRVQEGNLRQKEKFADMKRAGVHDRASEYQAQLAILGIKHAAALDAVAAEAKAQAIRNGATPEQAENNVIVQQTKQKGLELRASNQEKLQAVRATQALAGAHLALARETADAARDSKKTAADDKKEITEVRAGKDDPTGAAPGSPIGRVPSGKGGAQAFATRDSDYARALQQLEAFHADIVENGERPLSPAAMKHRETLKHNADIAVATVSPLGKTDEAMKAEAGSIGSSGVGLGIFAGANPEAVRAKIDELKEQRQRYREETLIPLKARAAGTPAPAAPAAAGRRVKFRGVPGTLVGDMFTPDP